MTTTTSASKPVPGLARIEKITDPRARAVAAAELLDRKLSDHAATENAITAVRDAACQHLVDEGTSAAEVGRLIRRTRSLVAKRFPAPKDPDGG